MMGMKRPRAAHRRRNARRDAEIYGRIYVSRELTETEAAAWYGLTQSRVSEILTEEHARRSNIGRESVVRRDATSARNGEIYRRVVELREVAGVKAAVEYGVTRQRVSQILDAVHLIRHGVKRPRLRE